MLGLGQQPSDTAFMFKMTYPCSTKHKQPASMLSFQPLSQRLLRYLVHKLKRKMKLKSWQQVYKLKSTQSFQKQMKECKAKRARKGGQHEERVV